MGLFKAFKAVKEIAAAGSPDGHAPRGMTGAVAGLANVMSGVMAPMLVSMAPQRGKELPATEPAALAPGDPAAMASGQAALHARDSAFDPGLLTAFADEVFAAVTAVWVSGDPGPARGVLADALWDPLAAAATITQAASGPGGASRGMGGFAGMQVGRAAMSGAHAGQWYDSVMFAFDVSLGAGAPPMASGPWKEDWLFQRSVVPGGDPMTPPETCPSCGSPTALDDTGACTRCRQPVPVCTAGWLVSRIVSHNPLVEQQHDEMIARMRANPEQVQHLPEALRALLPPDLRPSSPNPR